MKSSTQAAPHTDPQWKGYDIEELRYRRAYIAARADIEKERIAASMRQNFSSSSPMASGLLGKLLGSLTYFDYGVIAFRLGKRVLSLVRSLRRR